MIENNDFLARLNDITTTLATAYKMNVKNIGSLEDTKEKKTHSSPQSMGAKTTKMNGIVTIISVPVSVLLVIAVLHERYTYTELIGLTVTGIGLAIALII